MREAHERGPGDYADTESDCRPDAAAGLGGDSPRQPVIPIVRDSSTRMALALEYRQRVEGTQVAAGTAPREDRTDRAPDKGDQVSGPPPGKDTGVQGDDHHGKNARPQEVARRPARGADLPASARELRTHGTSCRTWRGPRSTSGSSASTP
jgi:hypothetical protein